MCVPGSMRGRRQGWGRTFTPKGGGYQHRKCWRSHCVTSGKISWSPFPTFVYIPQFPLIHLSTTTNLTEFFSFCFLFMFFPLNHNSYHKMATICSSCLIQLWLIKFSFISIMLHLTIRKKCRCSFATKCSSAITRNSSHTTTPSDNSRQNCSPPTFTWLLFMYARNEISETNKIIIHLFNYLLYKM